MKYKITKIVEAKSLMDALKKESKSEIELIEKLEEHEENKIGF